MFVEIIVFFLTRFLFFFKLYVIRKMRVISRSAKFLEMHDCDERRGKVYGHVSDLSHTFFSTLYNVIVCKKLLLRCMVIMICICINTSSLVLIDAMIHSPTAANLALIVAAIRSILQLLYRSSPPDGRSGPWFHKINHWSLPARDETFFSGHTVGVTLPLLLFEYAEFIAHYLDYILIKYVLIFNFVFIILSLIVLRIHYIIDVYSAVITCLLFYKMLF